MFEIEIEQPAHKATIEGLLDSAFGPGRFAKSSYRLRENRNPINDLCLVGSIDGTIGGSLRFWPIRVGNMTTALLLGPLAVDPEVRGKGLGIKLMEKGLSLAMEQGHELVFLVGDAPYYERVGFAPVKPGRFKFPGPLDEARLLFRELKLHALEGVSGAIEKAPKK
jgi:predicted N-acetyltransferase YhbS